MLTQDLVVSYLDEFDEREALFPKTLEVIRNGSRAR
jgi:hypothetical protein